MDERSDSCSLILNQTAEALSENWRMKIRLCYDPQEEDFVVTVYELMAPVACQPLWRLGEDYDAKIASIIKGEWKL